MKDGIHVEDQASTRRDELLRRYPCIDPFLSTSGRDSGGRSIFTDRYNGIDTPRKALPTAIATQMGAFIPMPDVFALVSFETAGTFAAGKTVEN